MRIIGIFWVLFALYFILIHPAIIYYGSSSNVILDHQNPIWALIYLGISIVAWLIVFGFLGRKVYNSTFGLLKGVRKILKNGQSILGEIASSKILKQSKDGKETDRELLVNFTNFSGSKVQYPVYITDTQPNLIRFENGNSIRLKVDKKLKHIPYVIHEEAKTSLNIKKTVLQISVWALSITLVVIYFVYAYTTESMGYGWRFLSLHHPLLLSPLIALLLGLIYYQMIVRLLQGTLLFSGKQKGEKLLFYGKIAQAKILNVTQTGTYINENPQVKFTLEFRDDQNLTHQKTLKKVIQMIDLPHVKQEYKTIFYLPEDPSIIAFKEDILIDLE